MRSEVETRVNVMRAAKNIKNYERGSQLELEQVGRVSGRAKSSREQPVSKHVLLFTFHGSSGLRATARSLDRIGGVANGELSGAVHTGTRLGALMLWWPRGSQQVSKAQSELIKENIYGPL